LDLNGWKINPLVSIGARGGTGTRFRGPIAGYPGERGELSGPGMIGIIGKRVPEKENMYMSES